MADSHAISILVVDDQPRNVIALKAALVTVDCQVISAQSGREALKYVLAQDFAVILLDIHMPVIDGFETARLIRGREQSRSTPIIFLTAYDSGGSEIRKGYRFGGIDYIHKPFDADILRSKVAFFVELFRKSIELERVTADLLDREQQILGINADLERRVLERTASLETALHDLETQSAERLRTEAMLRRLEHTAAEQAAALDKASRVLVENFMDHRPVLARVAQVAATTTHAACVLQLSAEDSNEVGPVTLVVEHPDAVIRAELTRNLSRRPNHSNSPWIDLDLLFLDSYPLVDSLAVPMLARATKIGVLALARFGPTASQFTDSDRRFADDLAVRIALAVENARLYEKARAAIELRDTFLTIAAHELKTPLTAIQGYSQLLATHLGETFGQEAVSAGRWARMIEDRTKHLARLVEQILDVTRLVASKMQLDPNDTDLGELVGNLVARFKVRNDTHEFHLHISQERSWALVDPMRVEQVMTNLIDNAVRYSPDGGPIDITVDQEGESIVLSVRDRGLGISEEHRVHLFERFHQAHAVDWRSGMGLGLHISREIVLLHGGKLTVAFPVDGGTQFTIHLPRTAEIADAA